MAARKAHSFNLSWEKKEKKKTVYIIINDYIVGWASSFPLLLLQLKGAGKDSCCWYLCRCRIIQLGILPCDVFSLALVPTVPMCKLWKLPDREAEAGNSCRLTAGIIPSPHRWVPKLDCANGFHYGQLYFSTKHSKLKHVLNYEHYWFIIAGEINSVFNYHLAVWAEG